MYMKRCAIYLVQSKFLYLLELCMLQKDLKLCACDYFALIVEVLLRRIQ